MGLGETVVLEFAQKGWAAYDARDMNATELSRIMEGIRKGRSLTLEKELPYVLFPLVEDHADPDAVMEAIGCMKNPPLLC